MNGNNKGVFVAPPGIAAPQVNEMGSANIMALSAVVASLTHSQGTQKETQAGADCSLNYMRRERCDGVLYQARQAAATRLKLLWDKVGVQVSSAAAGMAEDATMISEGSTDRFCRHPR